MNCCTECFSSEYVKSIINGNSKGNCNFCNSNGVTIYNPRELSLLFQNLLDLFVVNEGGILPVQDIIPFYFNGTIFSDKVSANIKDLLMNIIEDDSSVYKELFENNVELKYLSESVDVDYAGILEYDWDLFCKEIKGANRFHLNNQIDLPKLKELLKYNSREVEKGKIFFRARISDKDGYPAEKMGNPPNKIATSGRANPEGISYLYIANDLDTTLYEARASLLDFVTIGEFRLTESIKIVDLRQTSMFDPMVFADEETLEQKLIHLPFMEKLESELAKPIRRSDSNLDYLPTQYLCEFIKSLDYDGVEYKSSLNDEGFNIALFNTDKAKCIKHYVHEIKDIKYTNELVKHD